MKNIFSEQMSVFIKVFQGFGLYPTNKFLKFYSGLNFMVTVLLFISAFKIYPVLKEGNSLSTLVGGLVFVGILFTHLLNVFQAYISRHDQAEIYQKLDEIDTLLSNQLLVTIDYDTFKRKLLIKYFIISAILLPIHVISIVSVTLNDLFFSYHLHLIFPVIIIRFRCMQNMFYIDLVKEKLQLLNQRLERNVDRRVRDKLRFDKDKIFMVTEKFLLKREIKGSNTSLYDSIVIMKTIYGKIWDITNLCNECFGYSLLFIVNFINF